MATWTAKTIMATTKAPRNDFRLIPWKPWALPALPSTGVLAGDRVVEVDDKTVDAAVLAADDTNDADDVVDDMVAPGGQGAMELREASPRLGKSVCEGQRRCALDDLEVEFDKSEGQKSGAQE